MATPEISIEEKFAPKLPGPIGRQVEQVETQWKEESRRQGMTEEEIQAEEERLRKEAEEKETPEEKAERLRLEEEERQRQAEGETVSKKDFDDLQQKFNVLKGKYDAEKGPDLRTQLNTLMEQNNLLRDQIKMLQEKKPEPKKVSLRESPKIKALKEEFTPEVYENLVGALEETVSGMKAEHEQEIAALKGEVGKTIGATREETFWNSIFEKYPNYEQIRVDPKFGEFLNEEEGMSGYTRYDFLMEAFKKLNSGRVVKYLEAFHKRQNPEKIRSQPNEDKMRKRLGAPAGTGAAQRQATGQGITPEEVSAAKDDLERIAGEFNRGLWKGREKEYEKEEARLWKILDSGPSA